MTQFVVYPELDDTLNFPPLVRQAIADSPELTAKFATITALMEYIDPIEVSALLQGKMDASVKGQPLGVAGLDSGSKILETNIPTRLGTTSLGGTYAGLADMVFNVKNYGAKGDGTTDDTLAINNAEAARVAAAPSNTFGLVTKALYFPAGRYIYSGNLLCTQRTIICGDGPYVSNLYRKAGSTGDLITLRGSNSGIRDMTLGGGNVSTAADLLVLDSAYTWVDNCTLTDNYGNGITVGKTASAIGHIIRNTFVRRCKGYGINIVPSSDSTDGMWSNVDTGMTGLAGVRLGTGSQNLSNIHTWQAGLETTNVPDRSGFLIDSGSNSLVNCQAETNNGSGVYISGATSRGNSITGGKYWANKNNAIYVTGAPNGVITGIQAWRNGVGNIGGSTSTAYAGIFLDSASDWDVAANKVWDDTASIADTVYTSYTPAPSQPYTGRAGGVSTMSRAYVEAGSSNNNSIAANSFRSQQTRSGVSVVMTGVDNLVAANDFGIFTPASVIAAATVTPFAYQDILKITGSATINTIYTSKVGRRITLIFMDAVPGIIANMAGNIHLAGAVNWTPTQDDTLTLVSDGTNWYETSRSAN